MRSAQPSMYSSNPSRFCLKYARLPHVVPYLKPSLSSRTSMRSPRMIRVPCVNTTWPSNTDTCLASSTVTRSASRLMGFSRSAFSACASPMHHANTQLARMTCPAGNALRRERTVRTGSLFLSLIIGSFDFGFECQDPGLAVQFQADRVHDRVGVGNQDRTIGPGDIFIRDDLQIARSHDQLALVVVGPSSHANVVVKINVVAIPRNQRFTGGNRYRRPRRSVVHESGRFEVGAVIVGIMDHFPGVQGV